MKNEAITVEIIAAYHTATELGRRKYVYDHLHEIISSFQIIEAGTVSSFVLDAESTMRRKLDAIADDIIEAYNPDYSNAAQIIDDSIDYTFPKETEDALEELGSSLGKLDHETKFVFAKGLDKTPVILPVLKQGEDYIPFNKIEGEILSMPVDIEVPVIKYYYYKPAYTFGPRENWEPAESDLETGIKTVRLSLSDIIYDFADFISPNDCEEMLKETIQQEIEEPEL